MSELKTYQLRDSMGYYWIWFEEDGKINLNGPHSEKMLNLPVINVKFPFDFKPKKEAADDE